MRKGEEYIRRLERLAEQAAKEYKEVRIAPFEVDTREIRLRKERYIKWSYCLWGAIQALGEEELLNEEKQLIYEDIVMQLDTIAYEEEE